MSTERFSYGVEKLPPDWRKSYFLMLSNAEYLAAMVQADIFDPPSEQWSRTDVPHWLLSVLVGHHRATMTFQEQCRGIWLLPDPASAAVIEAARRQMWRARPRGVAAQQVVDCFGIPERDAIAAGLWQERQRVSSRFAELVERARQSTDADPNPARRQFQEAVEAAAVVIEILRPLPDLALWPT